MRERPHKSLLKGVWQETLSKQNVTSELKSVQMYNRIYHLADGLHKQTSYQ